MSWLFSVLLSLAQAQSVCTTQIKLDGVIGPATVDYIKAALRETSKNDCKSVLVLINTPGGNLQSTRMIVEDILNSPVPFLCLISPSGGHAGSAGAIIMQACHVSGALPATNIGAATPVMPFGEELTKDIRNKIVNDTVSWVEGIASLRGRSQKFARDIVENATSLEAAKAKEAGGIDLVPASIEDFLTLAQSKETMVVSREGKKEVAVQAGKLIIVDLALRHKVLDIITDPQLSYFVFMGSLALLYFEITHPGVVAPGVIGAIGLVVSLISFHKLDVEWGGLALLLLGIILMVIESFVPSFGALGIGGIAAFTLGSLFLFDPLKTGFVLPLQAVLPTTILLGLIMLGLGFIAFRQRRLVKKGTFEELIGDIGVVEKLADGGGLISLHGEIWKFATSEKLVVGDKVKINGHDGLVLRVQKT